MRVIYSLGLVIGFFVLVVVVTGYVVGENYSGKETFTIDFSKNNIYSVLTDIQNIQTGKKDIESIEVLGRSLNLYAWKENLNNGGYRIYRQTLRDRDQRFIIEMTESSYNVTGTWEFVLEREDSQTKVTIIENSKNTSILNRGVRFYFGRNKETKDWIKFIRVRLFNNLLTTS